MLLLALFFFFGTMGGQVLAGRIPDAAGQGVPENSDAARRFKGGRRCAIERFIKMVHSPFYTKEPD